MATKEIVFPAGVGRGLSFRQEVGKRERYYSPWALNCRTEDFAGRLRGGSWTPTAASAQVGVIHSGGTVVASPGGSAPGSTHAADCIYRDRFIRPVNQAIWASRQGAYTDWRMSADLSDVGRPFVIQLSEAGELGGAITALIPHKDGYMLAATSSSLWVVQGDPTADGQLRNISRDVGIIGARAWCRDHLDRYYFMSSHGLYTVGASGDGLQALSEDVIPEQLTGVTDRNTVLEYDHALRSVYIHIPDSIAIDGEVTASDYTVTEDDTVTLTFDDTSTPTEEISWVFETEQNAFWPFRVGYSGSHVAIGPISLNDGDTFGRLLRIHGITAASSANVTWRVLVADTAEQVSARAKAAIEALMDGNTPMNIHSSGTWTAGVNHRAYPRARGLYMILLLSSSGTWAWEGAVAFTEPSGKWR